MTVIVWDGKTLAADRRASIGGSLIREVTKIFRVGECLVGYSGDSDLGEAVLDWFRNGRDPATYPNKIDNWAGFLVVWPDGSLWRYERTPFPLKFDPQTFAVGSGRDFALAAVHCGKTAAEAVLVASHFESGCGNGVDTLTHEQ